MKIRIYADPELEKEIKKQLKETNGHCPCSLPSLRNKDTICMCKNFKEAPIGSICHCGLYIKEN